MTEQERSMEESNQLLEKQLAEIRSIDHRERMRGVARHWEDARPVAKYFFKNPYGQYK